MWYFWEKGQFCNSLDPCAIEDSLCRAAPVPLWQSQCGVHLTPSLGGMTLTWCCLRSSALISASLLLDLEFQEGELEGGWSGTEKPTTQVFQIGSYQAWVELQVGDRDSRNEGVIAGNMKSVEEYEAKGKKEL